jgi:hypothetical protein
MASRIAHFPGRIDSDGFPKITHAAEDETSIYRNQETQSVK